MDKVKIFLDEFAFAIEWHSDEMSQYLDVETGRIVQVGDLFDDEEQRLRDQVENTPERYRYIEPIGSGDSYRIMEDFVNSLPEGEAQKVLSQALQRRRPFRNFKDDLYSFPEVQKQWYRFHEQRLAEMARQWLEDNDIDAELITTTDEE